MPRLSWKSWQRLFTYEKGKIMRKIIMAVLISAAFVVSGLSVTTLSGSQLTSTAWANGGD
jgi:hypothetical protein